MIGPLDDQPYDLNDFDPDSTDDIGVIDSDDDGEREED